ncbi:endopeptidase La [Duncaniella freteri]|jgi:ATP-dependent Lon protease|uniref:endopeptidase La n=3 Tax=Duncaniella TaxID=2518495 RepID=UPI00136E9617|nr:endopeptidase La [Duncaniella freteri]NBJ06694.1 endopeptidase La [Alistipes sp. Z76]NCE68787.1 endopeptidase La [Muribaculaceae bacterium M3]
MKDEPKIISIGQIDISPDGKQASPTLDDLPVIPLRDMVLFPFITVPIMMGRDLTVRTVNAAVEKKIPVGVFCQTDPGIETPSVSDLNTYGVIADVVKVLELPDGTTTAILSARGKVKILGEGPGETIPGALSVRAKECRETTPRPTDKEFAVLIEDIRSTTLRILGQNGDNSNELIVNIKDLKAPGLMVNMISTHAGFDLSEKMDLLRHSRLKDRAMQLMALIARQEQFFEIRSEIRRKAMKNIDEQQRNHFLQHEFEALREQLYGNDDDSIAFEKKAAALNMPEKVRAAFNKELEKLRRLNPQSPDYSVQYSYLQVLTDLPWNVEDAINADFSEAERTLDRDHYGLEKVKERILEQLAVMMNTPHGRSPIICLVGAPGVGKTSLGQSIARALNRKYQRVSLGGLHDESEIRGHRRTYIGAMPGRIIDAVRRAGSSNPVLLLDEIDKTGNDFKGDPSAALLEVLDPEQNSHFHDNYVDVDYDLSHVLFIATANTLSTIPQPLLDRMEIIDISGYLMEEKIEIARRHLIPRVSKENGFGEDEIDFTPEAITKMVEGYTSESGVRQLEKQIAKVVRRIVLRKMRGEEYSLNVTPETLREYLGVERFTPERYEASDHPGVAVGLAWTAVGGEILFIESSFSQAKNEKLTLTGNLGDVMKESAIIASQIVRSYSDKYGIDSDWFDTHALHIHVPEGAIPKDGPSAGITLCTSILSALTGRPVRNRLAMTGEITLRGKVLPVGGIKEKILAAKRAGITDIILCADNRKDIEDIRPIYLEGLTFHYVKNIEDVFDIAITK